MADPKDDDKGTGAGDPPKDDKGTGGGGTDRSTIKDVVREVLAERSDGGKARGGRGRDDDEADITARVEAAVEKVNAKAAAAKKEADAEARLKALEEGAKKQPEKQPREFRKATRWMRWATDDDH